MWVVTSLLKSGFHRRTPFVCINDVSSKDIECNDKTYFLYTPLDVPATSSSK